MVIVKRNSDYIEHHGVDGQQWGVRNGSPYPLDRKQKAIEKRRDKLSKISNESGNPVKSQIRYAVRDFADAKIAVVDEQDPVWPGINYMTSGVVGAISAAAVAALSSVPIVAIPMGLIAAGVGAAGAALYKNGQLRDQYVKDTIRGIEGNKNLPIFYTRI